jgi:hypothetical protein
MLIGNGLVNFREVELMKSDINCQIIEEFRHYQPQKIHHFLVSLKQQLFTQP